MAGLFRAYGQLRTGNGPWRSPFLIPIGDLVPPLIQGSSHVSIANGGTQPDLRLALVPLSVDQWPALRVQFRIQPMPGRILSDLTLRIVLLKQAESPFLDDGPLEEDAGFVVLHYRVGPGRTFPNEVRIDLASGVGKDDLDSTEVPPAGGASEPVPAGHRQATADLVGIDVVGSPPGGPLDVAGGMVDGDMVTLSGVVTDYNALFDTGYSESATSFRGVALDRLEIGAPPNATLPVKATWFEVTASQVRQGGGPPKPDPAVSIRLSTPTRGAAPADAPNVASVAGGSLRPGTYRYCTTFLHANGNESAPSKRSAPVTVGGSGDRAVQVTGLPAAPPPPNPDPTMLRVTKIRVYRTDCDRNPDPGDPTRGDLGDDVLVAEVDPGTTSVTDNGPSDPSAPPQLRSDFLVVRYFAPTPLDLNGAVRFLDGADDTRYSGAVLSAPERLKVLYRPDRKPRIRWLASGQTGRVAVGMPAFSSPYGTGLDALVDEVPVSFCLDWSSLGSEHFALALAGDVEPEAPVNDGDDATEVGLVAVRLGGLVPLPSWPSGELPVTVELSAAETGSGHGSIVLWGLRRGMVRSGSALWSERDAEESHVVISALFRDEAPHTDRRLRFAYRGGPDAARRTAVNLTGHFVPAQVAAEFRLPEGGDRVFHLASRLRFLRGTVELATRSVDGIVTRVEGPVFVDDTSEDLHAVVNENAVEVTTRWPVHVGGHLRLWRLLHSGDWQLTNVWLDALVPAHLSTNTGLPLRVQLAEPGVSGRFALSMFNDKPLATRAGPQLKLLSRGPTEIDAGFRAATVRLLGLTELDVPEELVDALGDGAPTVVSLTPHLVSSAKRANRSFRVELQQVEHRVPSEPDAFSVDPARSWLRVRVAAVPEEITPTVVLDQHSIAGIEVRSSSDWGGGVFWAEPRVVRDSNVAELGEDKGIGVITAGFDGVPSHLELWLLDHATALGNHLGQAATLPTEGPVVGSWPPGGAVLRLNGPLNLSHIMVTLPAADEFMCREAGGAKAPAPVGVWTSMIAPFLRVGHDGSGLAQLTFWSTGEPPDPNRPPVDLCAVPPEDRYKPPTALGWAIGEHVTLSTALRLYRLLIPTHPVVARWGAMPTTTELLDHKQVVTGIWDLQEELQMRDYRGTVVIYPKEKGDNPFGDWQGGVGEWFLRQRGGLDVPLIPFFWWEIPSGDVFMGNVGGGYHVIGTNGIFSTLPRIWTWSYP